MHVHSEWDDVLYTVRMTGARVLLTQLYFTQACFCQNGCDCKTTWIALNGGILLKINVKEVLIKPLLKQTFQEKPLHQ